MTNRRTPKALEATSGRKQVTIWSCPNERCGRQSLQSGEAIRHKIRCRGNGYTSTVYVEATADQDRIIEAAEAAIRHYLEIPACALDEQLLEDALRIAESRGAGRAAGLSRDQMAAVIRDWMDEQGYGECNAGVDTCPNWTPAYEAADLLVAAIEPVVAASPIETHGPSLCACCEAEVMDRGASDPWQGALSAYCLRCAEQRCDAFPGSCREKAEAPRLGLVELQAEIERQNTTHPSGYPATRDGIRLGLACAQDELEETLAAWRADRCKCPAPRCDHAEWEHTFEEAIQTAAVLMRLAASISPASDKCDVST